jgi:hypothetical protein
VSGRGRRAAVFVLAVAAIAAGCSSSKGASKSTTTTRADAAVTLTAATRIVERSAPELPAGQAQPLLAAWCSAARSGDAAPLVTQLQALPALNEAALDEVLGALQTGADRYCPADAAAAPDLLTHVHDAVAGSTTTTSTTSAPPTTTAASPAAARTATTAPRRSSSGPTRTTASSATTASTTSTSPTTSTTDPCQNVGNGTSGVMVGNGGATSCSHSTGG